MLSKVRLFFFFGLTLVMLSTACTPPIRDGVLIALNPTSLRVKVNNVATLTAVFSKPRETTGKLTFRIIDDAVVRPAALTPDALEVKVGQNTFTFDVQGIAPGVTQIIATMEEVSGEKYPARTTIEVTRD